MQSSAPRFRIPRDVWIGLAALALGAWYWRAAGDIPISPLDGIVNATVLPHMLGIAMMLFSVLLILRAVLAGDVAGARAAHLAHRARADREQLALLHRALSPAAPPVPPILSPDKELT